MTKKITLVLLVVNSMATFSQELSLLRPDVIPPSPNVANQMKFVETPVSLFTGTPQISIPIYTIQEGNYSLPISLDYNAGGIKVSEIASWVGLAWTLNAGGIIGRSTMGLPDEDSNGFLNSSSPILANYSDQLSHAMGWRDNQPDVFYFRFAGYSGRFFFDKSGTIHTVPKTDFKIEKTRAWLGYSVAGPAYAFDKWVITTSDGIKYTFNDYELGVSQSNSDLAASNYMLSVNSWYLSKIEFPEGGEISFTYTTNHVTYNIFSALHKVILYNGTTGTSPLLPCMASWMTQDTDVKHLSAINFSNGRLRFVKTQRERADLRSDYALQKIVLENASGTVLNQWELNYKILEGTTLHSYETISISGSNTIDSYLLYNNTIPLPMKRRLMLTGIRELNASGTAKNNGYAFEYYHTIAMPNRFYPRYDYWGYANESEIQLPYTNQQVAYINGAYHIVDRIPNFNYAKQGTLYKIIHPTHGETHFEYELHTFSNGSMPGASGASNLAGGLRVKKRTYYDPVTTKSVIKNYYYSLSEEGLATPFSGTVFGSPVYYREYRESKGGSTAYYLVISSESLYPLATRQGSYVAYREVTEESTDISENPLGKSFYTYTLSFDDILDLTGGGPGDVFGSSAPSIHNPDYPTLFPNSFPYPPADSREWCNGLLISRKDYAYENNRYEEVYNLNNIWEKSINTIVQGYKVGITDRDLTGSLHSLRAAIYNVSTGTMSLKQTTEKEKRSEVWVTLQKTYEYGETKELPIHTCETLENNKKLHQYFSYPKEYATGTGFVENLKTKNILNKPIEIVSVVEMDQSFKITKGTITEYNNEGLPTSIKLLELEAPLDKNQFRFSSMTGAGILPGNGNKSVYTPDSKYKERATLTYDRGRLYRHAVNNIYTYYLWGYNRQYPVVQITSNESSLDFKSKLTTAELTNVESGSYTTDNMVTVLNKIRTAYQSNSNVSVETFTYIPFRGVVNQISPNGINTKNEYDSFGRLQLIKDHNGKTIEQYEYNYQN